MKKLAGQHWATILFFSTICTLFIAGAFAIGRSLQADGLAVEGLDAGRQRSGNIASLDGGRIMLRSGKEALFGNAMIVYRGRSDDHLTFDLFILELDPHYAYERQIAIRKAKKGFRLGDQDFRLLTARESSVKLELIN